MSQIRRLTKTASLRRIMRQVCPNLRGFMKLRAHYETGPWHDTTRVGVSALDPWTWWALPHTPKIWWTLLNTWARQTRMRTGDKTTCETRLRAHPPTKRSGREVSKILRINANATHALNVRPNNTERPRATSREQARKHSKDCTVTQRSTHLNATHNHVQK